MAEHATEGSGIPDKYYFLIRRLHSLSGIIPLAVFLAIHLITNASILGAKDGGEFQRSVERIHSLGWLLIPVEVVGILIPLLFHTLVGFQIAFSGRPNAQAYPYGANIRYTLQRVTAYIAFLFIAYHLYQMHWVGKPLGGGAFDVGAAATTTAEAIQQYWWITPIYVVGILATVFHCANGVWTALITWGITIRPRSQQVAGYVCTIFGVLLGLAGLGALVGFRQFDLRHAAPVTGAHAAAPAASVER